MRFGVCCSLENAPSALRAGADYVELPAWPLANDADYREALKDLPVEAVNLFFPGGFMLRDDPEAGVDHGLHVADAGKGIGISVYVVGSGGARSVPFGEDSEGLAQFVEVVAAIAARSGEVLAPESLNRLETNVGNDLYELATVLNQKGIGYTADSYHVLKEWHAEGEREGFVELWNRQLPICPAHVHVSDIDRRAPSAGDQSITAFFQRLKALNYDHRMSFECRWDHFEVDLETAVKSVKEMWESA